MISELLRNGVLLSKSVGGKMHKTAVLLLTLYEFEIWSLALSKNLQESKNNTYTIRHTKYLLK
jgi:hypothetical protein